MRRAWRIAWTLSLGCVVMSVAALLMLPCALLGQRGRRINAEAIGCGAARIILACMAVKVRLHEGDRLFPKRPRQVVVIANHSSTLDALILLALGMPNTRFFLKRAAWFALPMGLTAALMGTFFTMPQRYGAQRVRLFQRAARRLRRTGESVFLSPEGTRVTHGGIGHFNRGAFHLALNLQVPIVPLFIAIPRACNHGKALFSEPCQVDVHVLPDVETRGWQLEHLEAHIEGVREHYLAITQPRAASA